MTAQDTRQRIGRLRRLAERLDHSAQLVRNGDNTAAGERTAIALSREAAAVRWALLQLDPLAEAPRHFFDQLNAAR